MKPTLTSYLDLLTPWISPDLISAPYLNRIYQIAARLPVLSFGSFECWLDANEPRVDFNIGINPRINEHITVRDWSQEEVQFESDAYREMMERIRSFCALRSQKDFFLEPLLGDLWEVFDIIDPYNFSLPVPWIYTSFLKTFLDGDQTIKAEIISKTLSLIDNSLSPELKEKLRKIISVIPPSIHVGPIGVIKRNNNVFIRLFLAVGTFEEVLQALKKIDWPGNFDEFTKKVMPWVNSRQYLGIALDFDGTIQSKVGIECHFHPGHFQEELALFTQDLCEQGLCSIAKRNAILDWNGEFKVEVTPDFWSSPNRIQSENIPTKVTIKRIASFVKIIFEPNKPLVAKAYPLFFRSAL